MFEQIIAVHLTKQAFRFFLVRIKLAERIRALVVLPITLFLFAFLFFLKAKAMVRDRKSHSLIRPKFYDKTGLVEQIET